MSQAGIAQTISKMAGIKTATLGWDVVVSYAEPEINKLLESDFKSRDTKQIKEIECRVTRRSEPRTIDFKFELSAPLISFAKTRTTAVCNLTVPVVGGYGKTTNEELPIKKDVYTLHLKALELATASGDNDSYTPPNQSFIFPRTDGSDGFVVIDLRTSESLTIDITAPDGLPDDSYNDLVEDHKEKACSALKTKLRSEFLNVRYELARVSSDRPVDERMVQLVPRSFRFAAYEPHPPAGSTTKPATVLSLFIQTRDGDNGKKDDLDEAWSHQWHTTLQRSPIPTSQTASIIFNKHMVYESIIVPALKAQGFSGKGLSDTTGSLEVKIDTGKRAHRDKFTYPPSGSIPPSTTYSADAVDVTLPLLTLTLKENSGSPTYASSWGYEYSCKWSIVVPPSHPGSTPWVGHGETKATHTMPKDASTHRKVATLLDDYSLTMNCSISKDDWKVDFKPEEQSSWDKFCGGSESIPRWMKDLDIEIPTFDLQLGSVDFFLTTNLLFPGDKQVIDVDRTAGLHIPGDLYLVGKVRTK